MTLLLPYRRRATVPTFQRRGKPLTSYHSASLSLSARRVFSCFDDTNAEANVRANDDVATGHVNVDDNDSDDDDDDDDVFARKTLTEILGPSSTATPAIDLDSASSDMSLTYDSDRTPLLSSFSPPPPLFSFHVVFFWEGHLRSISIPSHNHYFPSWWLCYNQLSLSP